MLSATVAGYIFEWTSDMLIMTRTSLATILCLLEPAIICSMSLVVANLTVEDVMPSALKGISLFGFGLSF